MERLRRFSIEEIMVNDCLRIRYYDFYLLHGGYKVINACNDEIIGYITFNQYMKLPLKKISSYCGIEEYVVLR